MSPLLCRSFSVVSLPFVHTVVHHCHRCHTRRPTWCCTTMNSSHYILRGTRTIVCNRPQPAQTILSDSCSLQGGPARGGEGTCVNLTVGPDSRTNIIASQRELGRYCILPPPHPPPRPDTLTETRPTTDVHRRQHWELKFVPTSHHNVLDNSTGYGR